MRGSPGTKVRARIVVPSKAGTRSASSQGHVDPTHRGCHDASDPHVLAMRRTVFPLSKGRRFEHGLSFLATLAFLGGFFGARLFHLAFPSLMVITQGIHFHHFWYGLAMMGVAGWLGIVDNDEKFARVYAVVFGVGAGFVGDEVGLLLTFDDYYSELTFEFLVASVAFLILVALMIRYRKQILEEVFHLSRGERLTHVGVFLIGFSALSFAFGIFELGTPLVVIGIALFVLGYSRERGIGGRKVT